MEDPTRGGKMDIKVNMLSILVPGSTEPITFEILESGPDGNCLFRSIAAAIHQDQNMHELCRGNIVNYIVDEKWDEYRDDIFEQPHAIELERNKEKYKKYMLTDAVYGTAPELTAAGGLHGFIPIVIRNIGDGYNILRYADGIYAVSHFFLFRGSSEAGHFDLLKKTDPERSADELQCGNYSVVSSNDGNISIQFSSNLDDSVPRIGSCVATEPDTQRIIFMDTEAVPKSFSICSVAHDEDNIFRAIASFVKKDENLYDAVREDIEKTYSKHPGKPLSFPYQDFRMRGESAAFLANYPQIECKVPHVEVSPLFAASELFAFNFQMVRKLSNGLYAVLSYGEYNPDFNTYTFLSTEDTEAAYLDTLRPDYNTTKAVRVDEGFYDVETYETLFTVVEFLSPLAEFIVNLIPPWHTNEGPTAEFRVHTRKFPEGKEVTANKLSLFKEDRQTVFVIHGWRGQMSSIVMSNTVAALLQKNQKKICETKSVIVQKYNVVTLLWKRIAATSTYVPSKDKVPEVAQELCKFMVALRNKKINCPGTLILIGHSLGAQVAGQAGQMFRNETGKLPGRIYALDPAGFGYTFLKKEEKLSIEDACNVCVLHTTQTLGHAPPCGDSDVYINWGDKLSNAYYRHSTVVEYFNRTVDNPYCYTAIKAKTVALGKEGIASGPELYQVGFDKPKSDAGLFFFNADTSEPYEQE